jgi:Pectinacetylesterase
MKNFARIAAGLLLMLAVSAHAGDRDKHKRGLNADAAAELRATGVDKYLGQYEPAVSVDIGGGWTKHTFDPANGDGPICIAGTPFSVFTRIRNPNRVMIFLQGGGACWQDFYFCNVLAEAQEPGNAEPAGIWTDKFDAGDQNIRNPLKNWSVVYMPYCDGSVFNGDNDVFDPAFGAAIGVPQAVVRFHRGLRNASAGIDVAKALFPDARRVLVAGSSAGGVGATGMAPLVARLAFGNKTKLSVYNDAGPVAVNLNDVAAVQQRAADWRFGQFFPASCTDCDDQGQGTALIDWRLSNDKSIREAFYSTDADLTNRFFLNVPTQAAYRDLLLSEHGALHDKHGDRYKRFIRSGDGSHIALQSDQFYTVDANGVILRDWFKDFLLGKDDWDDIVEDFVPFP